MTSLQTVVIADDLTGAADCQFQIWPRAGTRTRIVDTQLDAGTLRGDMSATGVLVLDTEARFAAAEDFSGRLIRLIRSFDTGTRIYLKVDSTLRGDLASHLRVAATLFPTPVPLVLAHPEAGRATRDGRQLVDGVPVEQTPLGSDPVHPVASSLVSDHLPGFEVKRVSTTDLRTDTQPALEMLNKRTTRPTVVVFDAESIDDLERVALVLTQANCRVICGAAGLLRNLSYNSAPAGQGAAVSVRSTLVACGSLHPVSRAQVAALRDQLGLRGDDTASAIADIVNHGCAVLETPSERSVGTADDAGRVLADAVGEIDRHAHIDALILVGGRTAFHVCRRLDIDAFDAVGATAFGSPVCTTVDGRRSLVLKPGGFGNRDALLACVRRLAGE